MDVNTAFSLYLVAKAEAGHSVAGFRIETRDYAETCYTLYCGNEWPTFLGNEREAVRALESAVEMLLRVSASLKARDARRALLGR